MRIEMSCHRLLVLSLVAGAMAMAVPVMATNQWAYAFGKGTWNTGDWFFVSLRDMPGKDEWIQKDAWVENDGNTTSMLLRKKFKGDLTITSTLSFAELQAPTLIFATKVGDLKNGNKEYEEDVDVTLWHQGINVWRHTTVSGKSVFDKIAFSQFKLQKDTKYKLQVIKKGKELTIKVGDQVFGCLAESLTDEFYVGIMACEGVNRFYDFTIQTEPAK